MKPKLRGLLLGIAAGALVLGLFWTPYDPASQAFREQALQGSSPAHWLGLDALGRDVLSRLWRGTGTTALMAVSAMALNLLGAAILLGVERNLPRGLRPLIPAAAGLAVAVPVLLIGLLLLVFLNPSPVTLVLAAAIGNCPLAYRQLRIHWLELRHAPFVQASEALGARPLFLLRRTLWPNLKSDSFALAKLVFALSVLELSGLSFLGLAGDPDLPELGAILRQSQMYLFQSPLLVLWPGIMLCGLLIVVHKMTKLR